MLVLSGDVFEHRLAHGVQLPIGIEETDDRVRVAERAESGR
jgi:hypothetical protein